MTRTYIHFQDFVDAWVGPFGNKAEVDAHIAFCKERGDAADVVAVEELTDKQVVDMLADGEMILTADEDRRQVF